MIADVSTRTKWREARLGEVLPLKYGKARSEQFGYPRPETSTFGSNGAFGTFPRALTQGPSILVGRKGAAGTVHYSTEPCWPIDTTFYTEGEEGSFLPFFRYLLESLQLVQFDRSTAVPSLSRDDYNSKIVAYPEALDEQRRIVAEVEKQFTRLDAGVAALRRVQANLKRYRTAVLNAACEGRLIPRETKHWEVGSLRDVLVDIEAGKSFRCEERPPTESEIGVVKVSAVTWGNYNELESKTCLNPDRIEERYLVNPNDFLFSRANTIALVGACVIAQNVTLKVMLSDKILRFHFSSAVNPKWILYWLRSDLGRGEIERLATGNQESMRNIGQERIRQIVMEFPPLPEQALIVSEVERRLSVVEELEATVSASLQRATRLRQSILQKAFSGNL